MTTVSILIVEDEAVVALDLRLELQGLGYTVADVVPSAEAAVQAVERLRPDLILMDVHLQGQKDGIEAAQIIAQLRATPLIYLTSHSDSDTVRRAASTGAYGYLTKPYQAKELRAGIEVAVTKSRMERKLREADRWFAHTLRCVADGVVVTDCGARVRFMNPAAEYLTGWSVEAATGHNVAEVVPLTAPPNGEGAEHSAAHLNAEQLVKRVLADGRVLPVMHGHCLRPLMGVERLVDHNAGPVDDDLGQRMGAVLVLRDAASRLSQQAALQASESRFRSAFESAPLGMALVGTEGDFLRINDAFCSLLADDRAQLLKCNQADLTHPDDRAVEHQHLQALTAQRQTAVQFDKRYLRGPQAEPVSVLVSVSWLQVGEQSSCYLYQVHDLTAQKLATTQQLVLDEERMKRQASELAGAARAEFLSRVGHEMRTPLNAVIGLAQVLQKNGAAYTTDQIKAYARHIRSGGEHLLALVTDLLDLNLLNQGALKMDISRVDLSALVQETVAMLDPQAQAHRVQLHNHLKQPVWVSADLQRLRQVLLNLGSNAIKYNRVGGSVVFSQHQSDESTCVLAVRDDGIGMTPEQLNRLFQPFDRLGAERSKVQGTGLGLVISLGLVQQMNGQLQVDSKGDVGTQVLVSLPRA